MKAIDWWGTSLYYFWKTRVNFQSDETSREAEGESWSSSGQLATLYEGSGTQRRMRICLITYNPRHGSIHSETAEEVTIVS